jgi:putative tryptophan/tyrosine transport system substrate-binding protein
VKRREFIAGLGGAAAWPLTTRAQQSALPVVGWLGGQSRALEEFRVAPFREGLKEAGYVEGQNVAIEYRFADGQYDRLPVLAADLVRRGVAVIALIGTDEALAAKAATTAIPIVFHIGGDPIRLGLVTSLNRPAGNLTGMTSLNEEVLPKQFELLHELMPTATTIGLLVNPASAQIEFNTRWAETAAHQLGLKLHVLRASAEQDLDTVFETLLQLHVGALVIGSDSFFTIQSNRLGALALRHSVPVTASNREFAVGGGLMCYGPSITDLFRKVGVYTGRVLKGEKPADLPVQQPTILRLVLNMKTARALGLTVPLSILLRADEVIE